MSEQQHQSEVKGLVNFGTSYRSETNTGHSTKNWHGNTT